jgi:hypothetical protein
MKVLNFEGFLKIYEAEGNLTAELVGDSSVANYKALTSSIKASHPGLIQGGINSYGLLKKAKAYSEVDPNARIVFVAMGSNDIYTINPTMIATVASLRNELERIFPNAEFIVVKGGWGWGGLNKFSGETDPQEMDRYYDEVWAKNGFNVMDRSQGYSAEHHTFTNPNIKAQVADMESIVRGNKELYAVASGASMKEPSEEDLEEFYDALELAANERKELEQQTPGTYVYDPLVQRIQIGLEFLGKDLPRFGADGLYGPETAESIRQFKEENSLDSPGSVFGTDDMIALISSLKNNNFAPADLGRVWKKSEELAGGNLDMSNDTDYLYYMQHQQGPAGASSLLRASQGGGQLHPSTRANSGKYLTGNMPSKEVSAQIAAAIDANDDQRAATLFLSYWRDFWNKKKSQAVSLINQPKYAEVKAAIDSVPSSLPKDFLYTVAFIESGLDPKPMSSGRYLGLFAITKENLQKKVPGGDIFNPKDNAFAAIKGMEEGINMFSRLAGNYLKGDLASRTA